MEKEHLIFGIRAIIEAIQAGKEVDKVFIQKVQKIIFGQPTLTRTGNINLEELCDIQFHHRLIII